MCIGVCDIPVNPYPVGKVSTTIKLNTCISDTNIFYTVSKTFVSDKAGKKSSKEGTGFITRTHESIKCLSPLPFIALLPDLNGEPELSATFPENDPIHPETDR